MNSFSNAELLIREKANSDKELGDAFESLSKIFFTHDDTQNQEYSEVWHYSDWAKIHSEYSPKDIGIDLVAQLRNDEGFCAIQCKFYQPDYSISKSDLDSFISASSTVDFKRLVLIDTSNRPIGLNAQSVLNNLDQEYIRIQKAELEESRINWVDFINDGEINLRPKKKLRDHQLQALNAVREGLSKGDRGKIIMACGTGKTFTSLRIAEDIAGPKKNVLYMVPSLALMSQTIREWKNDCKNEFTAFSACSDEKVGKRKGSDDQIELDLSDLAFPATTNPEKLAEQIKKEKNSNMIVVFSTYQSINVISQAQQKYNLDPFDLIICDEAHRTTGATIVGEDESNFVKIHSNENIIGEKRLYMTATPRIYGEKARKKQDEGDVYLASMDDEEIFGKTLFHRGFGWAVENGLLTDYKVVVLMMDQQKVSDRIQYQFTDGSELKLDDATKMVGCYKALAKVGIKSDSDNLTNEFEPMKRALAFCQNINSSKLFSSEFSNVVKEYISNEEIDESNKTELQVELFHVDGTFNANQRNEKLSWLKDKIDETTCRVLSNARCLSEGVDVPALDAIMFLHPRKSQIDVVQSVGRVMRKAEGKKLGYVILPVTVAPGITAEKALNDNERYQVVWQILNALRAHDERFDSTINRIGLGEDISDRIEIIDGTLVPEVEAITAVVDDVKQKSDKNHDETQKNNNLGEENSNKKNNDENPKQLSFSLTELSQAIKAKIVDKCGTRDYWENWATDIANIAQQHISRINSIVLNSGTPERDAFVQFLEEIRDDLNPEISETDAVEMLAQHIITRPVFETLFKENRFTTENAFSKAMEVILSKIYNRHIDTESRTLEKFYNSVRKRAADIVTAAGRQVLILELYDKFFRYAFPLMTQKLGIVYTPVEIVDFIIHSVEDVMQEEFNSSLGNDHIHILDPFTGTGTFISRLIQSKIIPKENLIRKFKSEIHANEIILLAYYIACINIESVYDEFINPEEYTPFNGMVLTDTFQLYEQEKDLIANLLPDNSERRVNQKNKKINVIIGNPPYSAKQTSANDNAANLRYTNLDKKIEQSYAAGSSANNKLALYDSYLRAFKWASERIGEEGVIGFVTNGGYIDGNATDGFRKSLESEFSKIYIFHLRGDQRTAGERSKREGGQIFGSGSRAPIAISILIKKKNNEEKSKIYLHDIGDYLDRAQKLAKIALYKSIKGIKQKSEFLLIEPDEENDWVNQIDKSFKQFPVLGNKKDKNCNSLFKNYSLGVNTNRDAWSYNFSPHEIKNNIQTLIATYNKELSKNIPYNLAEKNPRLIKWSSSLENHFKKNKQIFYDEKQITKSLYRPFTIQYLYRERMLVHRYGQMNEIFPDELSPNKVICVSGIGVKGGFTALMSNIIIDINLLGGSTQCFPLYLYRENGNSLPLFSQSHPKNNLNKQFGITKFGNDYLKSHFKEKTFSEEHFFYYLYGLFHSPEYINKYANNLSRELPRVPMVKKIEDFVMFSEAGRKLSDLHCNFEKVEKYPISITESSFETETNKDSKTFFNVKKMKFATKKNKFSVIYNKNVTINDIPSEAFEYKLCGRSALEWVMDRQSIKIDKSSGIVNDPNEYFDQTNNNSAYPLELFQKMITVSIETTKIVKSLPKFEID